MEEIRDESLFSEHMRGDLMESSREGLKKEVSGEADYHENLETYLASGELSITVDVLPSTFQGTSNESTSSSYGLLTQIW